MNTIREKKSYQPMKQWSEEALEKGVKGGGERECFFLGLFSRIGGPCEFPISSPREQVSGSHLNTNSLNI